MDCRRLAILALLFAAMIAVGQRKLPDSVQQAPKPVQKAPQPAADRFQPFRYRMAFSMSSAHVAGFQEAVVKSGSPGAPAQSPRRVQPGMNKNTNVTLKRGVVHMDSAFAQWVGQAKRPQRSQDVVIDSFDEAGRKDSSMHLGGCVVVEYQSVPDLDGSANSATIRVMTLHCSTMKRSTR
jgi:phage tail-like protein